MVDQVQGLINVDRLRRRSASEAQRHVSVVVGVAAAAQIIIPRLDDDYRLRQRRVGGDPRGRHAQRQTMCLTGESHQWRALAEYPRLRHGARRGIESWLATRSRYRRRRRSGIARERKSRDDSEVVVAQVCHLVRIVGKMCVNAGAAGVGEKLYDFMRQVLREGWEFLMAQRARRQYRKIWNINASSVPRGHFLRGTHLPAVRNQEMPAHRRTDL
jgi:hypothetical protein